MDIEPELLIEPPVDMHDMRRALAHTKPSVNKKDLDKIAEFTAEFGQDA